jgi:hypothetical protein
MKDYKGKERKNYIRSLSKALDVGEWTAARLRLLTNRGLAPEMASTF